MPMTDHDDTAYEEIRATARLHGLDVDVLHRRAWDGSAEQLEVTVRTVPPLEALGRLVELSNPLLVWTRMMQAAWSPWMRAPSALTGRSEPASITKALGRPGSRD